MNPGRFYLPSTGANAIPMIRGSYMPLSRNLGLFGRITNSIKTFNWGGLLNGANKTLNVVNQTIPLVRQAGPMLNNMKSMLKIARAFGSETNKSNINAKINNSYINKNCVNVNNINNEFRNTIEMNKTLDETNKDVMNENHPNFFI
jgi:hypothetical protein